MPFRAKAKALFRSSKSRSDSLSKASTINSSSPSGSDRHPSNVYAPGEVMPRPKYRKPPTKEHKEKLEAFSFADAWRRKSFQSQHSPGGTRVPSRRNSVWSVRKKSFTGRSSLSRQSSSASHSGARTPGTPGGRGVRPRDGGAGLGAAMKPTLSTEEEAEGDDDVHNVGLSRVQSHDRTDYFHPLPTEHANHLAPPNGGSINLSTAHDHHPFTENDLALALQRSHLAVPAQ